MVCTRLSHSKDWCIAYRLAVRKGRNSLLYIVSIVLWYLPVWFNTDQEKTETDPSITELQRSLWVRSQNLTNTFILTEGSHAFIEKKPI